MVNQKVKLSPKPPFNVTNPNDSTMIQYHSNTNVSQAIQPPEEVFEYQHMIRDQPSLVSLQHIKNKKAKRDMNTQSNRSIEDNAIKPRSHRGSLGQQELPEVEHLWQARPPVLQKQSYFNNKLRLSVETWLWEKEQSHRLFNFHEGYRVYDKTLEVVGSGIIVKQGQANVTVKRASEYQNSNLNTNGDKGDDSSPRKTEKLVNVIYNEGQYHIYEPANLEENKYNIIDNHIWLIAKFMPSLIEVKEGDVIRFGRIPFKVAKLVVREEDVLEHKSGDVSQMSVSQDDYISARPAINLVNDPDQSIDPILNRNNQSMVEGLDIPTLHNRNNASIMSGINVTTFIDGGDMSFPQDGLPDLHGREASGQPLSIGFNPKGGAEKKGGLKDNFKGGIESGKACRICLDDAEDADNPFITPCKCAGSMKFIHLKCLREWLDSKRVSQKLEGVYSYYWEELVCELCKDPLALNNISLKDKSRAYYLLNFKQPKNKKYMVLESDIECLSKAIHVIVFSVKNEFHIGRRINNDITISDISVSRKQATIRLKDQKVYVEDCDSKFGTFVRINSSYQVPAGCRVPIQIEKKCFFFKNEDRFTCFQKCFLSCSIKSKVDQYDHYIDVKDKFPKQLQKIFLPQHEIKDKLNQSGLFNKSQKLKNKAYNRVIDESIITQMSNTDLNKLRGVQSGVMVRQTGSVLTRMHDQTHSDMIEAMERDHSAVEMLGDNSSRFKEINSHKNSLSNPFLQVNSKQLQDRLPPIKKKLHRNNNRNENETNGLMSQNVYAGGGEIYGSSAQVPVFSGSFQGKQSYHHEEAKSSHSQSQDFRVYGSNHPMMLNVEEEKSIDVAEQNINQSESEYDEEDEEGIESASQVFDKEEVFNKVQRINQDSDQEEESQLQQELFSYNGETSQQIESHTNLHSMNQSQIDQEVNRPDSGRDSERFNRVVLLGKDLLQDLDIPSVRESTQAQELMTFAKTPQEQSISLNKSKKPKNGKLKKVKKDQHVTTSQKVLNALEEDQDEELESPSQFKNLKDKLRKKEKSVIKGHKRSQALQNEKDDNFAVTLGYQAQQKVEDVSDGQL